MVTQRRQSFNITCVFENLSKKSTVDLLRTSQQKLKMLRLWSYWTRHRSEELRDQRFDGADNKKKNGTINPMTDKLFQTFFGSAKLLQTLLLMAGIESNPGPPKHRRQTTGHHQHRNATPGRSRQEPDNISIDSGIVTGLTSIQLRGFEGGNNQALVVDLVNEMQDEHTWGGSRKEYTDITNRCLGMVGSTELVFKLFCPNGYGVTCIYVSEKKLLLKIQESFIQSETYRMFVDICSEAYDSAVHKIMACIWGQAEKKFGLQVFVIRATAVCLDSKQESENGLYSELAEFVMASLNKIGGSEIPNRNRMKKFIEHQVKYSKHSLLIFEGFNDMSEITYLKQLLSRDELKQVRTVLISKTWNQNDIASVKLENAIQITGCLPENIARERGLEISESYTGDRCNNGDETVQNVVLNVLINILMKPNFTVHDFREKLCMYMSKVNIASLRNDAGLGLLHLIVYHNRVDFMEVLFDVGLWESLRYQKVSSCNPEYSGCDPFSLADKLNYMQLKESMLGIDAWEKQMTVLQVCARKGDEKLTEELIRKYPHLVGMKTVKGTTALYWACSAGSLETVRKLVSAGESPHDSTTNGENLLQRTVSLGHANLIEELTHVLRLPVNATDNSRKHLFEIAAARGNKECFDKLMENQSIFENSALVIAAGAGKIQFVKHLFSKYSMLVNVNFVDKYSKTALFRAAEKGHTEVAALLLRKGASITDHDRRRRNLFYIAAQEGHKAIIDLLILEATSKGILNRLINQQDWHVGAELCFLVRGKDRGRQAWHYVEIQRNAYHVFKERTKGGAIDVADYGVVIKSGWGREPPTAVIDEIDARYDERQITETTAIMDMSPLHISILKNNFGIAKKLILNGADVNLGDKFRLTPLHFACMGGNIELVDLLIQKNSSLTTADSSGKNAQQIAQFNQQTVLVEHLTKDRYNTMVQQFVQRSLDPVKAALGQEKLTELSTQGTDMKRYLIQTLRDLSTDINIFLFDIGSGPIQEESTGTEAMQPKRPNTY